VWSATIVNPLRATTAVLQKFMESDGERAFFRVFFDDANLRKDIPGRKLRQNHHPRCLGSVGIHSDLAFIFLYQRMGYNK